ncbi:hypothetical protein ACFQ9R_11580 [Nocardia sp. NPDC056541]|uniref:hypothetical protein n=1 Tax=Nocardia sp. NPDC056541 TaxID=3345860 RepID=UPI00366CADEE
MRKSVEVPILSRRVTEGGQIVVIEVSRPRPVGGKVECAYRLADTRRTTEGPDSLAALYRALLEIGDLLAQANRGASARFVVPANLGFPVPPAGDRPEAVDDADVVATQTIIHAGDRHTIAICRPVQTGGGDGMLCLFRVDGETCAIARGWDGVDAVLNAVSMIGARFRLATDWPLSPAGGAFASEVATVVATGAPTAI